MTTTRVVVLGSGPGRRFNSFQVAANRAGVQDVIPVAYGQVPDLRPGDWLRFDSPDESDAAMRAVFKAGASEARRQGYPIMNSIHASSAQLAFGLRALQQAAWRPGVQMTTTPEETALCYDKTVCAAHLKARGVPVPRVFPAPTSFDELLALLRRETRLFVKQRFGAGAAGTMALMAGPKGRVIAHTTLQPTVNGPRFVKRVQKVSDIDHLRGLFDYLHPLGIHVERWVPKAGVEGLACDLRIVAIQEAPPFAILRRSRSPITNLHLDAERGHADALFAMMPRKSIDALWETVHKVQAAFPDSLTVAPDIAVTTDFRNHFVLEVNAFGDHIRRMTIDGRSPQDWQVRRMINEATDAA